VKGPNSITSFFARKPKGLSDTSELLKETAVAPASLPSQSSKETDMDSGSDSESEPSKDKHKITYTSRVVTAVSCFFGSIKTKTESSL
jgi:hypothetical protein